MEGLDGLFDGEVLEGSVSQDRMFELDYRVLEILFSAKPTDELIEKLESVYVDVEEIRARHREKVKEVLKDFNIDEIAWLLQAYCACTMEDEIQSQFLAERAKNMLKKVLRKMTKYNNGK